MERQDFNLKGTFSLQAKGDRIPTTQPGSAGKKVADKKQPARKPADKKTVEKKQTEKKDKAGTIHVTSLSEQGQRRNHFVVLSKMLMRGSREALVIAHLRCCFVAL